MSSPLLWANLVYFACAFAVVYWLNLRDPARPAVRFATLSKWDWIFLGVFFLFACWLMFATLGFRDGKFLIAFKGWSDFGANISLLQSFVLGNNFPTTHPFFPGENSLPLHFVVSGRQLVLPRSQSCLECEHSQHSFAVFVAGPNCNVC
jgi:hypothetical protein